MILQLSLIWRRPISVPRARETELDASVLKAVVAKMSPHVLARAAALASRHISDRYFAVIMTLIRPNMSGLLLNKKIVLGSNSLGFSIPE